MDVVRDVYLTHETIARHHVDFSFYLLLVERNESEQEPTTTISQKKGQKTQRKQDKKVTKYLKHVPRKESKDLEDPKKVFP